MQDTRTKSARLLISKGIVFLRMAGMPSVACTLLELSDTSCRCTAQLQALAPEIVQRWKALLTPQQALEVDLSAPPHLPGVHCGVLIESIESLNNHAINLELIIKEIDHDEMKTLQDSLKTMARTTTQVTPLPQELPPPKIAVPRAQFEQKTPSTLRTSIMRGRDQFALAPDETHFAFEATDQWQACVQDPLALAQLPDRNMFRGLRVGEVLCMMGKLDECQAAEAQLAANPLRKRIGHYLVRRGVITAKDLCVALALQADLPIIDLQNLRIPKNLASDFSYLLLLRHQCVPFSRGMNVMRMAAMTPLPPKVREELRARCGAQIEVYLADDDAVQAALYELSPQKERKLRKHVRYDMTLPVALRLFVPGQDAGAPEFTGQTMNISEGGLLVRAPLRLKENGACLNILMALPPHRACGVYGVRQVRPDKHDDRMALYGCELLEMDDAQHAALKQICIRAGMNSGKDRWRRRRTA